MTIGVIDIGTNTVLLLVARVDSTGHVETILDVLRLPRLGKGTDENKVLSPEAMGRVRDVLAEYKKILSGHGVGKVTVAATSAVRDAANREVFRKMVADDTGYNLEILTGTEEAELTFRGAISGLRDMKTVTVVDIGGGSTEITTGSREGITRSLSLDIGAVRLTERFLKHDPPTPEELSRTEAFLQSQFATVEPSIRGSSLVGVAGTATSLAVLDLGLPVFERSLVSNHVLTLQRLTELFQQLRELKSDQIRGLSEVLAGREDIILAGTMILKGLMDHLRFPSLIVSERGIRYGLALRELGNA